MKPVEGPIRTSTERFDRMDSPPPDLRDLLGKQARILHTKRRFHIQKRIVEFDGRKYVLHRFLRKTTKDRFEATVRRLREAGVLAQNVSAGTSSMKQSLQFRGHWLALSYLPGKPIHRRAPPAVLAALGSTMARLNAIEGDAPGALFEERQPALPHEDYLAAHRQTLSPDETRWIDDSLARMRRLPGNQLTHGDLYGGNIIAQEDNSVGLIDYELMTYDVSGIELAATLLRPFCRRTLQRRGLLQAYLSTCPAGLRDVWSAHAPDLIFTAAARLLSLRQTRLRHLVMRHRIFTGLKTLLPWPLRKRVENRLDDIDKNIGAARLNEAYYLTIARTMVGLCLADPKIKPERLLSLCDAQFSARPDLAALKTGKPAAGGTNRVP
jgi:Ser/Thr protein kinase RdoA (MazF antagonist)